MAIFNNGSIENMHYLITSEKPVRNLEFSNTFVHLLNPHFQKSCYIKLVAIFNCRNIRWKDKKQPVRHQKIFLQLKMTTNFK